jgi:hypothetical protein
VTEDLHQKLRQPDRHFQLAPRSTILPAGFRPRKTCCRLTIPSDSAPDAVEAAAALKHLDAAKKQRRKAARLAESAGSNGGGASILERSRKRQAVEQASSAAAASAPQARADSTGAPARRGIGTACKPAGAWGGYTGVGSSDELAPAEASTACAPAASAPRLQAQPRCVQTPLADASMQRDAAPQAKRPCVITLDSDSDGDFEVCQGALVLLPTQSW